MDPQKVAEAIGKQEWLNPAEEALQSGVRSCFHSIPGGDKLEDGLHGTWLGHPVHSATSDVALGAWSVTAACDVMGARTGSKAMDAAADASLVVGMAGAVTSAASGITDWHQTNGRARRVGIVHGILNLTATGLYAASWMLRRNGKREAGRVAAWMGFGLSSASAWLGGHLAYGEKLGTDHSNRDAMPDEWAPLMAEIDIPYDQPVKAEYEGRSILLVRRGDRVFAMDGTCAHMGGQLAEGKLEGDTIQCPLHGSRYNIRDGHLVNGPSIYSQQPLDTRIANGMVEVRKSPVALPAQINQEKQPAQIRMV